MAVPVPARVVAAEVAAPASHLRADVAAVDGRAASLPRVSQGDPVRRATILLSVAALAVACADIPDAPPSLADQLADQITDTPDDEASGDDGDGRDADGPEPAIESGEVATRDDPEASLAAAVAAADARCAEIYARGDELAVEYGFDLVPTDPTDDADMEIDIEEVVGIALSLTEEVVVSLERGAEDDTRLESVATTARDDALPIFTELLHLMATADDDELDAYAMEAWPRLAVFVEELASLGFRHCFQEQGLIP